MTISRTEALKLSTVAYEMGADVLRGQLKRSAEGSKWMVGDTDLADWLEQYRGQELLLIVSPVGSKSAEKQVCRTCGREYTGSQCPYCREVRQRLRERE